MLDGHQLEHGAQVTIFCMEISVWFSEFSFLPTYCGNILKSARILRSDIFLLSLSLSLSGVEKQGIVVYMLSVLSLLFCCLSHSVFFPSNFIGHIVVWISMDILVGTSSHMIRIADRRTGINGLVGWNVAYLKETETEREGLRECIALYRDFIRYGLESVAFPVTDLELVLVNAANQ